LDPKNLLVGVTIIGQLKPGVSTEQARRALAAVKLPTLPPWGAGVRVLFADGSQAID